MAMHMSRNKISVCSPCHAVPTLGAHVLWYDMHMNDCTHCASHRWIRRLNRGRKLWKLPYAEDHVLRLQIRERCRRVSFWSVKAVKSLAWEVFKKTCAHMLLLFRIDGPTAI